MPVSDDVTIRDVEVVRATDLIVVYRVDGHEVRVPPLHIRSGTTAQRNGQRGTLVLPRWIAKELGLVRSD
jgi:hypothetical protein